MTYAAAELPSESLGIHRQMFLFRQSLVLFVSCFVLSSCGSKESDSAGHDAGSKVQGSAVEIPESMASSMHFTTEAIQERVLGEDLRLTGRIMPELGKETDVSARFPGRVIQVNVKPGQIVSPGQVLALIDSQELSSLQAELIEAQSKLRIAQAHEEREKQIFEENLQRPKALIAARTNFEQCKVHLELVEADFNRLEGLYKAKIAAAKDYLAASATLAKARLEFKEAQTELAREEGLFKNRGILRRDLQLAEAETQSEKKHFNTLQQRLEISGLTRDLIKQVLDSGQIVMTLPVRSAVGGVVTHQDVSVGELVSPNKHVFTITDLSNVMVVADLPEVESSSIKLGDTVKVRVPGLPNEVFTAHLSYISDMVNPESRTVPIRATLGNKKKLFKINMFADIMLRASPQKVLACPKSAIQEHNNKKIVFVKDGNLYKEREIQLGVDNEKYYQVVSGLKSGEEVVTQGSLMLKTELSYKH